MYLNKVAYYNNITATQFSSLLYLIVALFTEWFNERIVLNEQFLYYYFCGKMKSNTLKLYYLSHFIPIFFFRYSEPNGMQQL